MLVQLCVFLLLLLTLFLLIRKLTNLVFGVFLLITRHQKTAIILLAALLLPGTTIHELSHVFAAFLLRVPAGKLTVIPKIISSAHSSGETNPPSLKSSIPSPQTEGLGLRRAREIQAGSIMVGKTDPFRLTLIGLAPLPIGIALLYFVSLFFFSQFFQLTTHNSQPITDSLPTTNPSISLRAGDQLLMTIIGVYLLFTISCSMFSSKKDLKVLLISGPVLVVVIGLLYWGGVRIGIEEQTLMRIQTVIQRINWVLLLTLLIDGGMLMIFMLINRLFQTRYHG